MSNKDYRILSEPIPILEIKNMPNIVISGIYKIENIINHKVYIGKSVNVISRFKRGHLLINNEVNPPLKNAFKKYGYEQFSVEVIKETHDLNYWEMFLIQIYRATDKNYGYNICEGGTGGDTFSGRHHTEESKQKKREAMKRFYATKVWTDEERDRCRYWKGKHHTEEQKRKMSEVCKGINTGPKSEETKRKISQTLMGNIPWNKGIKMTEEQRLKQVEIKKKIYEGEKGEQIKQKLRDANVGNVWWNNGVIEVKSKEQPEGFLCGRINNHRNKWFTNGNVDIRFTHALDESYRYGRTYPDQKCFYWNNGKITVFANKCPGEGFVIGNLNFKYSAGMLYWNNGVVNVRSKECPGEGFVKGMLKKK